MKSPASLLAILLIGLIAPVSSCAPAPASRPRPVSASPAAANTRPVLRKLPNGRYRVVQPWSVNAGGTTWTVPRGYTTNGITAPAYLRSSLGDGVDRPETWSAIFHDWLFTQAGVSRSMADNLFHEVMISYGISPSKARLLYSTVRSYSYYKYGR